MLTLNKPEAFTMSSNNLKKKRPDVLPGSESEFPVGDWQKLEGMKTLFLVTVKRPTTISWHLAFKLCAPQ